MDVVSLAEAIQQALVRNPSAQVAYAEVRRADALIEQARSASLPLLVGTATYARLDSDRTLNDRVIASANQLSATATLSVPLVAPKPWAQWSHAVDNLDAQRATASEVRRAVAVAVGRAYLTVVAQKRVLDAAEHARDAAKGHFDFAHQRLAGGVGNRIDEVRAQQELAADEANVEQQRVGLARAREALGVVVGAQGPIDAREPNLQVAAEPQAAMRDAERRTDVVAAGAHVQAAERVVRDDWTDYAPYLTGVAMPFYQNPPSLVMPLTGWQAQLVLTLPLYDGGLRYGQWKERDELRSEARANLDATLRQARSDVRTAFEELRGADAALAKAREAADLAHRALDLAELAYRAGATTNIEVIDAERRARDAETAAAVAEDGARQARLDLLAATGRFP